MRNVAYFGVVDEIFINALKKVSDSLTIIPPSTEKEYLLCNRYRFDLVVARSLNLSDLKKGVQILRPLGYLYYEINRLHLLRSLYYKATGRQDRSGWLEASYSEAILGLRNAKDYITALERLGLSEVEAYWHRPSFEACVEIIPLLDSISISYVLSRGYSSLRGRLKLYLGRLLWKTGLLGYLVPCFSLVACKQAR